MLNDFSDPLCAYQYYAPLPPLGLCRRKGGPVLTLKHAPYVGNLTAYHMDVLQLKALMVKFPIFSWIYEWSKGWNLTDWHAQ